jgi:hypothetical protein
MLNTIEQSSNERLAALLAEDKKEFIVHYAYPTSSNASTLGMYRTGAYYVARKNGSKPRIIASRGYLTRAEAQSVCDILLKPSN